MVLYGARLFSKLGGRGGCKIRDRSWTLNPKPQTQNRKNGAVFGSRSPAYLKDQVDLLKGSWDLLTRLVNKVTIF